ncbi:2-keto-4-pentenoate hydratase/2-oxohepta-3-ene-1,7-dioic acid hydratase (catechol pathway) [Halobacillus dabanensis]|uniref:2-keto-4-pentenoate hydratase/2-oxohepta-3-ene-1,7-dioic acid hydratase (Catechol pathway) n=1 Tax=Halobacillus dabanensis TaxID=240302 RepID=A0A1I3S2H9_HALDA|nr:fumarylacetoacetate hydrolase family protein [Halobacillus dabanensis]SFJ52570.1 2-keto-4-pentenoate hydratase/2-oxohepta-3-ene-1,7-dioic acid hydratase (catechol pathway) [Halobacillus dabanensis]
MKYLRFQKDGENHFGVLEDQKITKLNGDFLEGAEKSSNTYAFDEVTVLPPVEPSQVVCIGLNYASHAEETGKPLPEEPMMWMVSPSAVISEGEEIVLPNLDHRIDYEAEIAIVIGKKAKNVSEEDALSYVFGYTIGNDVSDRHLQKKDGQFTRAKSFATFKPLGPVIETEMDPNHADIKLTLNGEVRQQSNTSDLIHNIEKLLVKVTEVMTLKPGDVILTGTPAGVGALSPGDQVEIEIEGIGKLTNRVKQ